MNFFSKLFNNKTELETVQLEEKSYDYSDLTNYVSLVSGNSFFLTGLQKDNELINNGFVSNPDVFAIQNKICRVAAGINLLVEKKTADGWEVDEDSTLNDILKNPNKDISGKEFRYNNGVYLLSTGDNFWRKTQEKSFGLITELHTLEPNLVNLLLDTHNDVRAYDYMRKMSNTFTYQLDEVIHSMFLNPSSFGLKSNRGLSPLQAGLNALTSSNNRGVATANMIENGGAYGVLSSGTDISTTAKEAKEMQKSLDGRRGGAKGFGGVMASSGNFKYTPIGMSATDLKMIEGGLVDLRTLCNIFGVDSTMFNDKASSTLDNVKVANKKLYTDAVIPLNEKFIDTYEKNIIPSYNKFENKELRIVQDLSEVEALQEDQKEKADKDSVVSKTIIEVLSAPVSNESKIQTLVHGMKLDEDVAKLIVGKEIVNNENI